MTDAFGDFLVESRNRCDQFLKQTLDDLSGLPTDLVAAMRYSLLNGGKRVRPSLAFAAAHAVSSPTLSTTQLAGAAECIHAYSLIHDDLPAMDDDDLRRGHPTCHIQFNEATAILAGDALQCLAFEITASSALPKEQTLKAIKELASASGAKGMVMGQAIDLAAVDKQLNLAELNMMHAYKTGALIEASTTLGGISVNANDTQLKHLKDYAQAVGLAFQVHDDVLDVTTKTEVLGKKQGSDAKNNKPTYVSLLGLETAQRKAQQLVEEAIESISKFGPQAIYLEQLANYIIKRKY